MKYGVIVLCFVVALAVFADSAGEYFFILHRYLVYCTTLYVLKYDMGRKRYRNGHFNCPEKIWYKLKIGIDIDLGNYKALKVE